MTQPRSSFVEHRFGGEPRRIGVHSLGGVRAATHCIALHSGPGFSAATLLAGAEVLARATPISMVDLPGCGASSRHPGSGYPMEAYIADVMAVSPALGAAKPLLLGHGWGAILAVETALAHPEAIAGLMLVNPLRVLNASGQDGDAQLRRVQRVDACLLARFTADVMPTLQQAMQGQAAWELVDGNPWWPQMWLTQWAGPATAAWHGTIASARIGMEAYFAHKGQAMFDPESAWARYDLATRLPLLRCPVSVLASRHDANYVALPHIHVDPLRAARPDLTVELTDAAGHFLISEAPALVAAHLQRHPALAK
jgi:pimeloyl-ACP methyl ester carboxylesterase